MAQLLPSPLSCPPFIHSFIHSFPTYFLHAFSLPSAQPWRNTAPPPHCLDHSLQILPKEGVVTARTQTCFNILANVPPPGKPCIPTRLQLFCI